MRRIKTRALNKTNADGRTQVPPRVAAPRVRMLPARGARHMPMQGSGDRLRRWRIYAAPRPVAVGGLVLLGVALRLWLLARGWPALDSDEAIVGLMGRHILYAGERPVFYYGQHYQGALDGYLAALFFAALGPTTLALRLLLLLLTIPMLLLGYALGRAAYGTAAGLLTLAYLALGPVFGLLTEVGDIGGYHDDAVLGATLCLLVYAELRCPPPRAGEWRARWRAAARYALMGAVAGLGLWSDQLLLPVVGAALLVLLVARPGALRQVPLVGLALGAVAGALPLLIANIQLPGVTWIELAAQSRDSHAHGLLPALVGYAQQVSQTLAVGLPALLGSPYVCIGQGGGWHNYPPSLATTAASGAAGAACGGLNALFALGVLACFGVVAWQLGQHAWRWLDSPRAYIRRAAAPLRRWTGGQQGCSQRGGSRRVALPRRSARAPRDGAVADARAAHEDAARLWLRAVLLLSALGTLLLYTLSRPAYTNSFTAARYLLPLYTALPLVFGVLWQAAGLLVARAGPALVAAFPRGLGSAAALGQRTSVEAVRSGASETSNGVPGQLRSEKSRSWTAGSHGGRRRALAACALAGLVLLLGFAAYGACATLAYAGDGALYALPAPPQDQRVLAALAEHGITRYVSDYWTCYRLVFESGERLRCGVRDGVNNTLTHNGAVNRYLPYLREVERTPHPAYIFAAGSTWDTGFAAWAASQHLPYQGYARFIVSGYAVYYYPGGQG